MLNTWDFLFRLFPICQFLKKYDGNSAICDLVAGITVGLTLIPQVIAYASLAGLESQYGLYSALCGGIVYAIFGTIPELNIAPTALLSLLTYQYTHKVTFGNVKAAVMLTFFAGVLELLCGILHLGFLVEFVSTPVVSAFTSAGAVTIASSQVKNLFGLKFTAESFVDVWKNVFKHITEVQLWDTLLGFGCIVLLLSMRKLKDYGEPPISDKPPEKSSTSKKCIWFVSVGRNAMIVVSCAVMAFICKCYDYKPFALTSTVPAGFPDFSIPLKPIEGRNGTNDTEVSEMISELGYGIVVIPFIAILANVGIAKAFAHGKVVDASQEMIAVGLCNIFGSFFGSYPVNASFSRAAVSSASGVRTPLSGIYTGIMVIMAFTFLTPYFSYIPKATLAAVIICAVIFMVEVAITKMIWKTSILCTESVHQDYNSQYSSFIELDLVPFVITFISCLLIGIELGILIGILIEVLKLMYFTSRPKIIVKKINGNKTYLRVTLTSSIFFSSAEYIREKVFQYCMDLGQNIHLVLIDCSRIINMDYTAGKCFGSLVVDLQQSGKSLTFIASREKVVKVLESSCGSNIAIYQSEADFELSLQGKNDVLSNGDVEAITTQL